MSGDCYNPYGCDWSVGNLWGGMDWLVRLDMVVLALMLAYTLVVVSRTSYLLHSGRRQRPDFERRCAARSRNLGADLRPELGILKAIASTAPFLGSFGTCLGIMTDGLRGVGMEKHAAMTMMASGTTGALIASAAGILVAIPAVWSHNYLCRRIELVAAQLRIPQRKTIYDCRQERGITCHLRKFQLARRLLELPSFASIAAPILALAVAGFMTFASFKTPVGLYVHLLEPSDVIRANHVQVGSLHVRVMGRSPDGLLVVLFDSKRMPTAELESGLRRDRSAHLDWTATVDAEDDAAWTQVASVIDLLERLHGDVLLLPKRP